MARHSLKYNTAILTVTGFLVKVIGFVYRVFIANSIGTEGLGLYQLVYPIYSLLVLVLSAGISVAVSRFVAEGISQGRIKSSMKLVSIAAGITLAGGVVICGILFINLDSVLLTFTGDPRTRQSLIWTLYLVPPIAAASAYKGYFYGKQQMLPNAFAQITEQAVKLVFAYSVINLFKGSGIEGMCLLATICMLVGECSNILVAFCAFQIEKLKNRHVHEKAEGTASMARKLLKSATPISANRLVLSSVGTVESLILPQRLVLFGMTFQESLQAFGRLSGMAAPLVFFPSMLPGALATALVPAIASAVSSRRYSVANRQISQSIQLTIIMGLIFTSFFAICSHDIAELIYPGKEVGSILNILSFTGVFLYLQQTLLGILNGLARESAILINTLTGSVIRLGFVWFCLPLWGVDAYVIGVIVGSLVSIILNFREVSKITGMSIDIGEWILKPLLVTLMGSLFAVILKRIPSFLSIGPRFDMVLQVLITMAVLLAAFAVSGIIKKEDIKRWSGRGNTFLFEWF